MTNAEIVQRCNQLAREFYRLHGCEVAEGYRFDQAAHPQEVGMWNLAVRAFDFIEGIDVEDALTQLEEEKEESLRSRQPAHRQRRERGSS